MKDRFRSFSLSLRFSFFTSCLNSEAREIFSYLTLLKYKVARMEKERNAYRILVGKPKVKRPLGRPRRRWVDNIKLDLREIGWDGLDWTDMAQDRDQWGALVNTVLNLRVP
jgi:hypothetical protein